MAASKQTSWLFQHYSHPFPLSSHLGALAGDLGCFPLDNEAYPPLSHWFTEDMSCILSLPRLGTAFAARIETVALPHDSSSLPLRLNAFRGDPASSEFD